MKAARVRFLRSLMILWFGSARGFARKLKIDEDDVSATIHGYRRLSPRERTRWGRLLHVDPAILFPDDAPNGDGKDER